MADILLGFLNQEIIIMLTHQSTDEYRSYSASSDPSVNKVAASNRMPSAQ